MLKNMILLIVGALIIISASKSFADETLHFVRIQNLAEQVVGEDLLKEVYKRAGIPITVTPLPGKRAIAEASSGNKHGETLRIFALGEKIKTLIRVPTPLSDLKTAAFAKEDSKIELTKREDLQNYTSAVVRGVLHTQAYTKGLKGVKVLRDPGLLFPYIANGRADIALTSNLDGRAVLKKSGVKGVSLVAPKLKTLKLYHYIHESKAHLVPKIDAIIKQMKESGDLAKLREELEQKYLASIK